MKRYSFHQLLITTCPARQVLEVTAHHVGTRCTMDRAPDAGRPSILVSHRRTPLGMGEAVRAQDTARASARSDTMEGVQVGRPILLRPQRHQTVDLDASCRAQAYPRYLSRRRRRRFASIEQQSACRIRCPQSCSSHEPSIAFRKGSSCTLAQP